MSLKAKHIISFVFRLSHTRLTAVSLVSQQRAIVTKSLIKVSPVPTGNSTSETGIRNTRLELRVRVSLSHSSHGFFLGGERFPATKGFVLSPTSDHRFRASNSCGERACVRRKNARTRARSPNVIYFVTPRTKGERDVSTTPSNHTRTIESP
jgi:hypothetical protein